MSTGTTQKLEADIRTLEIERLEASIKHITELSTQGTNIISLLEDTRQTDDISTRLQVLIASNTYLVTSTQFMLSQTLFSLKDGLTILKSHQST